jgi:hypothetical protein
MIPQHKVNEAYDNLNLPRDASIQQVRDRIAVLRVRLGSESESGKLRIALDAAQTLEQADLYLKAQRDAVSARTKTRSERLLDEKLTEIAPQPVRVDKRAAPASEAEVKRAKADEAGVKTENPAENQDNDLVFEKLNSLLRDEAKYLRAMTVLFNMTKAIIDKEQYDRKTIENLSTSIDTAITCRRESGVPFANVNEDNRKASTKVINLVFATDSLKLSIQSDLIASWSHSVIFRNSLFELDNFNFTRRCKELQDLISQAKKAPKSDRWLDDLLVTVELLSSKNACRVIPGRVNDAKTTMIEIFKITRDPAYPETFRDRITDLQKQFMSSLS